MLGPGDVTAQNVTRQPVPPGFLGNLKAYGISCAPGTVCESTYLHCVASHRFSSIANHNTKSQAEVLFSIPGWVSIDRKDNVIRRVKSVTRCLRAKFRALCERFEGL